MTYQRWARSRWQAAVGTAVVAALSVVAAYLAPVTPYASADAATTSTTTTTSVPGVNCSASLSGTALDRAKWVASASTPYSSANAPAHALDGNLSTRFSSNEYQAVGMYFEVDLGSAQAFDELEMLVPNSPGDYARGFVVEVSATGTSWTAVTGCTGTGTSEVVSFPTQTAQYVRVVLTQVDTSYWWSIDEFYLYGGSCAASASGTALDRDGWVASTNAPYSSAYPPGDALDGKLTTRFSTNEDQAAGLYFEVDLGSAQAFDELAMLAPNSPTDYARGYEVEIYNGSSWVTLTSCTGTGTPEIVSFPTQTAHYVRVVLTAGDSTYWWSIDEFYLYTSGPVTTTTSSTTTTTAMKASTVSLTSSANPVTVGDPVTYTARVVPTPSGGGISFFANGALIAGCYLVAVSTSTGEASCSSSYLSSARIGVEAFYSGHGIIKASGSGVYYEMVNWPPPGYWLATANGQVYGSGGAPSFGGVATSDATGPVVGIAGTVNGQGYWVVTADGTVANFGDAKFYGDLPDLGIHVSDIVAVAPTTDGQGYYLVGADGGFFTFGDARFHGSLPGIHVHVRDVVGMVASPGGAGYLLVGGDGGVFTFGASRFYGSLPGLHKHVRDVRAILPSSTGRGYILVGSDGGAFIFGTGVKFLGSLPGQGVKVADVVGIALTPDDGGYYMAGADGHVYGFGDAQVDAEPAGLSSNLPVAAIAGT
jgi:F5/8 type C domain